MTRGLYGDAAGRIPVEFDSSRFLNSEIYLPNDLATFFEYIDSYILDGWTYRIDIEFRDTRRSHVSTSSFKSAYSAKLWLNHYSKDIPAISRVIVSKEEVD